MRIRLSQHGSNGHTFITVEAGIIYRCSTGDGIDNTALYKAFKCIRANFSGLRPAYARIGDGIAGPSLDTLVK